MCVQLIQNNLNMFYFVLMLVLSVTCSVCQLAHVYSCKFLARSCNMRLIFLAIYCEVVYPYTYLNSNRYIFINKCSKLWKYTLHVSRKVEGYMCGARGGKKEKVKCHLEDNQTHCVLFFPMTLLKFSDISQPQMLILQQLAIQQKCLLTHYPEHYLS